MLGLMRFCGNDIWVRRTVDVSLSRPTCRGYPLPSPASSIASISCSSRDRQGAGAERGRNTHQYWAAEFLRQNRSKSWEGTVLGWFRPEADLAAVSLDELGLESIVKVAARLLTESMNPPPIA